MLFYHNPLNWQLAFFDGTFDTFTLQISYTLMTDDNITNILGRCCLEQIKGILVCALGIKLCMC